LRHDLEMDGAVAFLAEVGMLEVVLISGVETAFGIEDVVFGVIGVAV
jgi:hypothetical protein